MENYSHLDDEMNNLPPSKNKILIAFIALFLLITIIVGIYSPQKIDSVRENWEEILSEKILIVKQIAQDEFSSKLSNIKDAEGKLIAQIDSLQSIDELISYFSKFSKNENLLYHIYNNKDSLVAWNGEINDVGNIFNYVNFKKDSSQFINTVTSTHFVLSQEFVLENSQFLLVTISPFETFIDFNVENNERSFNTYLSKLLSTDIKIIYFSEDEEVINGRYFSFELLDNELNVSVEVIAQKPILDNYLIELNQKFGAIQSISLFLLLLTIVIWLWVNTLRNDSKIQKVAVFILLILTLRIGLFLLNIPALILMSELLNSAYFSSTWGFGIVKSPLELFLSLLVLISELLIIYKYFVFDRIDFSAHRKHGNVVKFLVSAFVIFISLALFRALGSAIKSVVFDSSIYYFEDFNIVPDPPILLMHFNILLMGVIIIFAAVILFALLFKYLYDEKKSKLLYVFVGVFVAVQLLGLAYHSFQSSPQLTIFLRFVLISLLFAVLYFIVIRRSYSKVIFLYIAFSSSFVTVSLLNHYNGEQQRESLKKFAEDLTRPKEHWLDYVIFETLNNEENEELILSYLNDPLSASRICFRIWNSSLLHQEGIVSCVRILDSTFQTIGEINFDKRLFRDRLWTSLPEDTDLELERYAALSSDGYVLSGIRRIDLPDKEVHLEVNTYNNPSGIDLKFLPAFMGQNIYLMEPQFSLSKVNLFEIQDGKLVNSISEVDIGSENIKTIGDAEFSRLNEAWLNLKIDDEQYVFYLLKDDRGEFEKVIAAASKLNDLSFNLFHFFKVFFIHSIIIFFFASITFAFEFNKNKERLFTFRAKLLFVLLFISIIPMITMAIYFKQLTDEKNESAIHYKLLKRATSVEEYLNKYNIPGALNIDILYKRIENDLGISFALYKDKKLSYASKKLYYDSGLLSSLLVPVVQEKLYLDGKTSVLIQEEINDYKFDAVYRRTKIGNDEIVIKVSDLFNSILLPLSETDASIFIFGVYSFAVLLIIVISTLLANQISSPIRKLTVATKSVASGDLGLKIEQKSRGEVQQLVDEFNLMVEEIKKNQIELAEIERESAWKEMAKQVAHEIKNPLTPMKLSVQQLIAAHSDKSQKFNEIFEKVTRTLINQIETLKNIASEFSSFARMPGMKMETIKLRSIIDDAVDLFIEEHVKISLDLPEDITEIKGDVQQLRRALINLVRNSIQANATEIIFKLTRRDKKLVLDVIDNGSGIPKEIVDKIFNPNFTTKELGMGVGLTLAKRLMENLEGKIFVKNTSSSGTTITLEFPIIN